MKNAINIKELTQETFNKGLNEVKFLHEQRGVDDIYLVYNELDVVNMYVDYNPESLEVVNNSWMTIT